MAQNKIRNKIITISGEPVTGKGTTVEAIKQKLLKQGYKKENIHIIKTGHDFREYFEIILELIRNSENPKIKRKIQETPKFKQLMQNKDYRKKLESAIAKLKKGVIPKNISIEQANNMKELQEIRDIIDTMIDEDVKKQGEEINSKPRPNDVWIFDSRLAFSNIPNSLSVRLTCRPDIAGQRLMADNTRGKEDRNYKNLKDAIQQREKRRIGEIERYKQRYGIDITDENNYKVIIDTSFSSVDDISDTILECMERFQQGKSITQKWASPKIFVPLQKPYSTGGVTNPDMIKKLESFYKLRGKKGKSQEFNIHNIAEYIREVGYNQEQFIEALEVDGVKYIFSGHHRNMALALNGKTIIPYTIKAKDDEIIDYPQYKACGLELSAREKVANCLNELDIKGHETYFRKHGEKFSYEEIYPDMKEIIKYFENYKLALLYNRKLPTRREREDR